MAKGKHNSPQGKHSSPQGKQRSPQGKKRSPKSKHVPTGSLWKWTFGLALLGVIIVGVPTVIRRYFTPPPVEATFAKSLEAICAANVSFEYGHPKQGYARTLLQLRDNNLIDATLGSGTKGDYRFEYSGDADDKGRVPAYHVTARPVNKGGGRSAYMDDGCVIHTTKDDRAATASDPALQ